MDINRELLNFYVYKKLIPKKDVEEILAECKRRKVSVRDYLHAKEYVTELTELEALGEYYNMPVVEIDMLTINEELFKLFTFNFMKKHKAVTLLDKFKKNKANF